MKQYLKTYDLILKTKGPVFVGSGKEIGKKEYVFLSKDRIGIPDISGLYQMVKGRRKDREFESFLLQNGREDLSGWLRKQNFNIRDLKPYIKYELGCGDAVFEKNSRMQILEAVKDPYGYPYIPGTTLKGMFRTVLLCEVILQNPEKYRISKETITSQVFARTEGKINRTSYLKKEISNVEATAYRTLNRPETKYSDAVNDYMQGFIVSDSEPLSIEDLYLCQKVDLHTSGEETRLPILRECIKPGTEIRFSLTIDRSVCPLTEENIFNAIAHFNEVYDKCYTRSFPHTDKISAKDVFLGGGCGFVSKTVIYALYGKKQGLEVAKNIFKKTGVPRVHKHEKDSEYGASPHIYKCARYDGKFLPMGLCGIQIHKK